CFAPTGQVPPRASSTLILSADAVQCRPSLSLAKEPGMRSFAASVILFVPCLAVAADWPHWLGPRSNGISPETGLATTWPATGPKVLWQVKGGDGYSSIVVVKERAYTLVQRDNKELVLALDAGKGTELWSTPLGPGFKNDFGNGPRSTPWVEGDRLYVQSVNGPLACLDAKSGSILWQKNLLTEFKTK